MPVLVGDVDCESDRGAVSEGVTVSDRLCDSVVVFDELSDIDP